jgi:hypothetical protein
MIWEETIDFLDDIVSRTKRGLALYLLGQPYDSVSQTEREERTLMVTYFPVAIQRHTSASRRGQWKIDIAREDYRKSLS